MNLRKSHFLEPVTVYEVLKVVHSSLKKTSMDPSGINFALSKECISILFPIFKSGQKDSFPNNRPVSIPPQFLEILEIFLIIGYVRF